MFAKVVGIACKRDIQKDGAGGFYVGRAGITYSLQLEFLNGKKMDLRIPEVEYTQIAAYVSGCSSVEEYEELIRNARSGNVPSDVEQVRDEGSESPSGESVG